MNVYLQQQEAKYKGLQDSINTLQMRAAEAKRDLTDEEKRSIVAMKEQGTLLANEIKDLSEIEIRNAETAQLHARVAAATGTGGGSTGTGDGNDGGQGDGGGQGGGGEFRSLGGARTSDRDPGIYTRSSGNSFMSDQFRAAKLNDQAAHQRLEKHSAALRSAMESDLQLRDVLGTTTGGGVGLIPPVWLAEQFAPILHRRLRVAALVRQVPWAGPFPWTIPVANTAATTTTLAEGTNPTENDPTYTTITVLPSTISGFSEVSRQMLEASNPAVDSIIWGDMIGNFYDNAETNTITAIEGVSGINLATVTGTTVDLMRNGVLDGIAAVEDNGGGDADLYFGRRARWHTYLKLVDSTGRPIYSAGTSYGPTNAAGIGNAVGGFARTLVGEMEALPVATSPTVNASRGYVVNSQEILFSISPPMQFAFEQPAGPALVRVGVWGYMAAVANRRPKAITRITYNSN